MAGWRCDRCAGSARALVRSPRPPPARPPAAPCSGRTGRRSCAWTKPSLGPSWQRHFRRAAWRRPAPSTPQCTSAKMAATLLSRCGCFPTLLVPPASWRLPPNAAAAAGWPRGPCQDGRCGPGCAHREERDRHSLRRPGDCPGGAAARLTCLPPLPRLLFYVVQFYNHINPPYIARLDSVEE